MKFEPVIKWSGSKRSLSEQIVGYFPKEIDTYYEPFCGSCSVGFQLMLSNHSVKKYVFSDINNDLINFMNMVKNDPNRIYEEYKERWLILAEKKDIKSKTQYYNYIRERYNKTKCLHDFVFLTRTSVNGLIRYNSKGEFNAPFHLTRNGINPNRFLKILLMWSNEFNRNNVVFLCQSYKEIQPQKNDYVFLDPPYANTKGMYYGGLNLDDYFQFLSTLPRYSFTFDGKNDKIDKTFHIPMNLYTKHIYLDGKISGFMKLHKDNVKVKESLYIKDKSVNTKKDNEMSKIILKG